MSVLAGLWFQLHAKYCAQPSPICVSLPEKAARPAAGPDKTPAVTEHVDPMGAWFGNKEVLGAVPLLGCAEAIADHSALGVPSTNSISAMMECASFHPHTKVGWHTTGWAGEQGV